MTHAPACQEVHYTSDQQAEQDILFVALFLNILHIFRVSALTKQPVIPPQTSRDTNKMRSSEVNTICGGKLWCVSRAYLIKDHLPTHFLGNPQRMAAADLKKKKSARWRRQKGLFLRKSTI